MKTGRPASSNQFDAAIRSSGLYPLTASAINVFQVNLGAYCNQTCRHCHVSAGPGRAERMARKTMEECLGVLWECRFHVVDITGGAPEAHPDYRWFVEGCAGIGCRVKTRTNLTILLEDAHKDLPAFFAANRVEVIASLPYYLPGETDAQRGAGVFEKSIEAMCRLNAVGYGAGALILNLVYNPCGAYLPPSQRAIEADFRRELKKRCGVVFTNLFTLTNMPVGRFREFLLSSNNLESYMERLSAAFNPAAAQNVMCRETISVGWDGRLYDCDFNQWLGLRCAPGAPDHISRFDAEALARRRVVTSAHCFGCAAGAGSSCTGAVAGKPRSEPQKSIICL